MRAILLAFLITSTALCAQTTAAPASASSTAPKAIWEPPFFNGIAAQVDRKIITYDDIRREMAPMTAQIRQRAASREEFDTLMRDLYGQILNRAVENALLMTEFNKKGYKVPAKDVQLEYNRVLKESFNGSVSDLVADLQRQGLTLPAYRKRLEENIMVTALQGRFRHGLPDITPEQIQAYYQAHQNKFAQAGSVQLSVITLRSIADEPAAVLLQSAQELRQKLIDGANFDKLAAESNQAGDVHWDWLKDTDLAEKIRNEVKNMKIGDISNPVKMDDGSILVIKLSDRKNEGVAPLAEVSSEIKKQIFEENATAAYKKWLEELKKKYFVKINA